MPSSSAVFADRHAAAERLRNALQIYVGNFRPRPDGSAVPNLVFGLEGFCIGADEPSCLLVMQLKAHG